MDAVTAHIRDSRLRVGDTLPGEGHFAGELGVSRAVMREAFGALAALRMIDVGNGRKPRVAAIDGSVFAASLDHGVSTAQISVADVWDVRRTIELRTIALAAENRTDAQAAAIHALVDRMADEVDDHSPTDHDIALHTLIAEASGNPLFVAIVRSFEPLMQVAVPEAWKTRTTEEQRHSIIVNHRALADAISARDPQAALDAMTGHFDASVGALLKDR
ncbi:FCD domain-containing protein [Sphingomonas sp. MG17]|jgi:DNA-binding FadR family transcriptional regulator|uniref:FCD domain-containing protein n=2 Tax=Sphingomonas tagetis TaxID=2949092 RepID=A0A9X2KJL8_9SPHN|nr:FCD domain-containing protein [Sphingomonas tagetis]